MHIGPNYFVFFYQLCENVINLVCSISFVKLSLNDQWVLKFNNAEIILTKTYNEGTRYICTIGLYNFDLVNKGQWYNWQLIQTCFRVDWSWQTCNREIQKYRKGLEQALVQTLKGSLLKRPELATPYKKWS